MKLVSVVGIVVAGATLLLVPDRASRAYDFFGGDIGAVNVTTPNECAAACDANSACQGWTWVRKPLKNPNSAVCFLKSPRPATASFNSVCTSDTDCLSGLKRSDGWCGDTPLQLAPGFSLQGQGEVLACASGQSCRTRRIGGGTTVCWFLFIPYPCHAPVIESTEFFCQTP